MQIQPVAAVEKHFANVRRFELFTGHRSRKNISFCERLGYCPFRGEPLDEQVSLAYMEKIVETRNV